MVDIAVIGAGPAGLSAAISARQRNKTVKVISNRSKTSWLEKAERIDNYPGMPEISGREILNTFEKQAKAMNAEIAESEEGLHEANYLSQLTNEIYLYSRLSDKGNLNPIIKRISERPVSVEALKTDKNELAADYLDHQLKAYAS